MFKSLKYSLIFSGMFFTMLHATTVVLQNGLNEYNGCFDAHMTNLHGVSEDVPAGVEEQLVFQE